MALRPLPNSQGTDWHVERTICLLGFPWWKAKLFLPPTYLRVPPYEERFPYWEAKETNVYHEYKLSGEAMGKALPTCSHSESPEWGWAGKVQAQRLEAVHPLVWGLPLHAAGQEQRWGCPLPSGGVGGKFSPASSLLPHPLAPWLPFSEHLLWAVATSS